ncbi:naphthalene 1,2-dioxygenase system ferredoxin subunit [Sphingobium sp. AP50]|uniref:non-heme iron oxygenase ferredoxin subunit n=1 Tax=Sphingobium sp. AP50 TaxID=1884369 RepID=UPI0008B943AB|nr:non-heme iron oxygenase ferredoxin subunit [Sphingobium sp. AP50]SEK00765.1 naphthalene 1,2-dioxygenase system ferredoxin subunit [Sphingobium sp. AP50]
MTGEWTQLGTRDAVMQGASCRGIMIAGHRIGLFMVDDQIFAIDDLCTHGNALLSDGDLEGYEIECPLHAGAFDVRSGKAMCKPLTRDVRCYELRVDNDMLSIRLDRP